MKKARTAISKKRFAQVDNEEDLEDLEEDQELAQIETETSKKGAKRITKKEMNKLKAAMKKKGLKMKDLRLPDGIEADEADIDMAIRALEEMEDEGDLDEMIKFVEAEGKKAGYDIDDEEFKKGLKEVMEDLDEDTERDLKRRLGKK